MLKQRVVSAIVLVPLVAIPAWLGGWWFTGLVALMTALAAWELGELLAKTGDKPMPYLSVPLAALLVLEGGLAPDPQRLQLLLVAAVLIGLTVMLFRATAHPGNDWLLTLGAAVYLGMTMRFVALLRGLPAGLGWIIVAALVTWITDSGAYFIGRSLGRHKLWPRISPKKTWEGLLGGLAVGTLSSAILTPSLIPGLTWVHGVIIGLVIGVVGPLGDLSESVFKRQVGAKDSSNLIPGHGGFFDRIDSFFFVGPAVYILSLVFALIN